MPNLNTEEIKKLKKGELWGLIALICAGIVCVALFVVFAVAIALSDNGLRIYGSLLCIPLGVFTAVAAVCNLKYGKALDRIIKNYVRDVFIENVALMHPERDSLTYFISNDGWIFSVRTNNFKEQIIFDFSAFGRLSLIRKASITTAIIEKLGSTFCRLIERGGKYKSVAYSVFKNGKQGKTVYIIENGAPDKKAYKIYRKQK
ncbi:MAG: hypothetical protein K2O89_04275 [Clostridia bacterium]|nr:hypothetical protein [Clostridia bacterium]